MKHSDIYDYLEKLQISVLFTYTAVEAFANVAIPENFTYERINSKQIREVLSKTAIERWCTTSEKVGDVLPLVFGVDSPKDQDYWTDFKSLEDVRNAIVHPKTVDSNLNMESSFFEGFFKEVIFRYLQAVRDIIEYYAQGKPRAYYPECVGTSGPVEDLSRLKGSIAEHLRDVEPD